MKGDKIKNILRKDLENLQYRFLSTERNKMMYEYINGLKERDYEIFYTVDNDQRIYAVFFAPKIRH